MLTTAHAAESKEVRTMDERHISRIRFLTETFLKYGFVAACRETVEAAKALAFKGNTDRGIFSYSSETKSAKQMWILFTLLTISISSVGAAAKSTYDLFNNNDLFAVSDPLKSIRVEIKRADHKQILNALNISQKRRVATQVHFVSELIGNINKKVDEKELAVSIVSESIRANYDPLYIAAVVNAESTFIKNSVSNKGARGLMQLLPDTAHFVKNKLVSPNQLKNRFGDIHNVDMNLQLGIAYLKHLEQKFNGDKELALIAYNWGPGNLVKALKSRRHIPQEAVKYARKIMRNHDQWKLQLNANKDQFKYLSVDNVA